MTIKILLTFETTAPTTKGEADDLRSTIHGCVRAEYNNIGLSEFDDPDNIIESWTSEVIQ